MKCISVIDQYGNQYEPTYPKRAKGLVRKGRAWFVDANTICLTCPSCLPQEETLMENYNEKQTSAVSGTLTAAEIFAELKKIREETSHITLAMEKLEKIPTGPSSETDVCKEKTAAILRIVTAREETNQALIHLYEKMYDDVYYETHAPEAAE